MLKDEGYIFEVALTSVPKRAIRTVWTVLDESDLVWITVHRSWRLPMVHRWRLCPGGTSTSKTQEMYICWTRRSTARRDLISQVSGRCYAITAVPSSRRFLDKNQILSSTKGQVVSEQWPTLRIFDFGAVLTLFCAATKPISKALDRANT